MAEEPRRAPAAEIAGFPASLYNAGLEAARRGDRRSALGPLRAAVELAPDMADAQLVLGKVLAQLGEYDEAALVLERVPRLGPERPAAEAALSRIAALRRRRAMTRRAAAAAAVLLPLALFIGGWFLAGHPASQQTAGSRASGVRGAPRDATPESGIAGAVVSIVRGDPALDMRGFAAVVDSGVLRLSGATLYAADRDRACAIASAIPGVRRVDASGLAVQPLEGYVVQPGDSYWRLAVRFYGKGDLWTRIAEFNRGSVDVGQQLLVGQRLAIPPGPRPQL
jgi:nucleoid-associated protein YgaU